jgi:hypothetical protein
MIKIQETQYWRVLHNVELRAIFFLHIPRRNRLRAFVRMESVYNAGGGGGGGGGMEKTPKI